MYTRFRHSLGSGDAGPHPAEAALMSHLARVRIARLAGESAPMRAVATHGSGEVVVHAGPGTSQEEAG